MPHLNATQLAELKAAILADPTLSALPNSPDDNFAIAVTFNGIAAPDFWCWRTKVSEAEYTGTSGVDVANADAPTAWSWTSYIARSVGEQSAWARMFLDGSCNPSLANVRQGVADIFSGSANASPAQRNHLLVLSKRRVTRAEKLFSSGTGSFASPATMDANIAGVPLDYLDVTQARNS